MNTAPHPDGRVVGERLLADVRSEAGHADNKAALLLGALSMTVGLLGGVFAGRGQAWTRPTVPGVLLWGTALTALAGALLCLLLAVLPRYGRSRWSPGRPLTYFGDIRRAAHRGLLPEALAATAVAPNAGLLDALTETSRIVGSKHRWIRAGLAAYCAGMLLLPAALFLR